VDGGVVGVLDTGVVDAPGGDGGVRPGRRQRSAGEPARR
jgi:hypothetical protein